MALHVVRHADAGHGPGDDRELNDLGRAQAGRIADLLVAAGVGRILTSRYPRCLQTVTPLADRLGLAVEIHDDLAEEADPQDAWTLLASLAGEEAVVCSHGNIISPVLDRVLRRGAEIQGEWSCRKGSIWTLHPDPDVDRPWSRAVLTLP